MNMQALKSILVALAAITVAACASAPPSRFYTLSAPASPTHPTGRLQVAVGPVSIPAVVDRPEIVVTVNDHEVWLDEFNRWASPLGEAIALAVVENLAATLDSARVSLLTAGVDAGAEYRVGIEVQRFETVRGSHALLDAVFVVRRVQDGKVVTGRTTAKEPVSVRDYDALAAAHSRAVARLGRDISVVIRDM
jgi:uncharacterized lipoprotein YmbA